MDQEIKNDTGEMTDPMTFHRISEAVRNAGFKWENDLLQIVGVRGHMHCIEVENQPDLYNDSIYVIEPTCVVTNKVEVFPATVDPGIVEDPNWRGLARLAVGQYQYKRGIHKGKHAALVQNGPVTVERLDPETRKINGIEAGWFGINIHRGGYGKKVGEWSHGCQVIPMPHWEKFWDLVENWDHDVYRYTLLEAA